jgi:hypothetical protein
VTGGPWSLDHEPAAPGCFTGAAWAAVAIVLAGMLLAAQIVRWLY